MRSARPCDVGVDSGTITTTSAWWCRASVTRRGTAVTPTPTSSGCTLVLVYRSVGMPLDEVRALLDDPSADALLERAHRLQHTIKAVEELLNAHRQGIQPTAEEQIEIFGTTAFGEEYAAGVA
jgi:hypothetical protein